LYHKFKGVNMVPIILFYIYIKKKKRAAASDLIG